MGDSRHYLVSIPDYDIRDQDYVTYLVQVRALSGEALALSNGIKSWCISRRFSEFYRLHNMLEQKLPTCLIPPLPSKQDGASKGWYKIASIIGTRSVGHGSVDSIPGALVGRRFDVDLIDSRRQALETFLNRCLLHTRIGHSFVLHSFLCDCDDWVEHLQCHENSLMDRINIRENGDKKVQNSVKVGSASSDPVCDTSTLPEALQQRSQDLLGPIRRFVDLRKQIGRRRSMLNQSYKQVADALHRWCPFEQQNLPISDSTQTLAHILDSYHDLLALIGDEESDIDDRLRGHMRYAAALFELCSREASIRQAINAERAVQNQLQHDALLLKGGVRPELIPSVVGPVSSTTNNILNGLKSLFFGVESSSKVTGGEDPAISKAMEQITAKINDSSSCLTELEEARSDFQKSVASEYAFYEKQQSGDFLTTMRFPRRRWKSLKAAGGERSASWAFELVNSCSESERKQLHAALESLSTTKDPTRDFTPVSRSQLRLVFLASATPFVGFGFLDNFIMLVALAAGIGNLISDLCGLGLVGYVERYATLFGVKAPSFAESQMNSKYFRRCSNLGRMFGIMRTKRRRQMEGERSLK
ncbi:Transmembrane protein 65 [Taenia crassiceps]|uniref:Transmembrane protein 65 n=1 Tax=Taenia crassiceps TaxID=6207 RepID=A0ABR4QDJ4_9CEST